MASGNCLKFKLIPGRLGTGKRRKVQTPTNDDMIDEGQSPGGKARESGIGRGAFDFSLDSCEYCGA